MATFIITAYPAEFDGRFVSIKLGLISGHKHLAKDTAKCATVADVQQAMLDMRDRVRTAYAGGFVVTECLAPRERAPNGYRVSPPRRVDCAPVEARPAVGGHSPWGTIDHVTPMGPHAVSVATPSHGGIWVTAEGLACIPEAFRTTPYSPGQWFEEDADWVIPYLWLSLREWDTHAGPLGGGNDVIARGIAERSHPDFWAAFDATGARKAG